MSDELYPLGPLGGLDVQRLDRTISDEFEDGSTTARRLWTAKSFKRRFTVQHENLTEQEMRKLAAFFTARDGRYDSFWYRDNHNRGGSAKVRLAGSFPIQRGGAKVYSPQLILEQTAPVRELPGVDDISAALLAVGSSDAPLAWWDANRGITYQHLGVLYGEPTIPDQSGNGYTLGWVGGTDKKVGSYAAQWQQWQWANAEYATGAAAGVSGPALGAVAQPAFTIMAIAYLGTSYAGPLVIAHCGSVSAGGALGIQISGTNVSPWVGASEVWTPATFPTAAYSSAACVWAAGSNAATTYINGASTAAGSNSRSHVQSAWSFMGASNGTKQSFGVQFYVAHVLAFNAALTQAQIKAVHNVFTHQYSNLGMTTLT